MKANQMRTIDELIAQDLASDPEYRAEWERTALARALAEAFIDFRVAHRMSQRALAARLAWRQSVVSRVEAAEHNPSMETLLEVSRKLGIHVNIDVTPDHGLNVTMDAAV